MSRTDRPRIGFLSPIWLPRFGGAEQYVHRLALELIARGFDVRAFTQTAEKPGRDNGQVPVTRYTEAGEFEFRSLLWRWPGKLEDIRALSAHYAYMQAAVRWVKDNGIDLCILDNGLQQVDFLHARELHMVLKAMGVRRGILHYDLATIVDDELHKIYMEQPGGWRTAGMAMLAKLKSFAKGRDAFETALAIHSPLVFAPDFVISCSAWSASFIDPLESVPKIVVHPLMDGARWGERLGPEKRLRPRSVLMINPQMRKGPEQMRNLIAAADPSWSFRVLKGGWGDSFATFKPLVEATEAVRQGRVEFLDYLEDLRQAYQSAGVLFFPSLREGYGMTAVEPMYAGTPVVSSNYPAIMEAVGRGAVALCPFKSPPEAWKRAVAEVLANRSEWSARALTRASNLAKRQEEEIVKLTSFLLDLPEGGT